MRQWLLEKRGKLTQQEVANMVGITRPAYTMIESGERNPKVAVAKRIGKALGFKWTIFFADEGNESQQKEQEDTK